MLGRSLHDVNEDRIRDVISIGGGKMNSEFGMMAYAMMRLGGLHGFDPLCETILDPPVGRKSPRRLILA